MLDTLGDDGVFADWSIMAKASEFFFDVPKEHWPINPRTGDTGRKPKFDNRL